MKNTKKFYLVLKSENILLNFKKCQKNQIPQQKNIFIFL